MKKVPDIETKGDGKELERFKELAKQVLRDKDRKLPESGESEPVEPPEKPPKE